MKRIIAAIILAGSMTVAGIAPGAIAKEQHPGQHNGGNPHTTNPCESDNNNPNCPGRF